MRGNDGTVEFVGSSGPVVEEIGCTANGGIYCSNGSVVYTSLTHLV